MNITNRSHANLHRRQRHRSHVRRYPIHHRNHARTRQSSTILSRVLSRDPPARHPGPEPRSHPRSRSPPSRAFHPRARGVTATSFDDTISFSRVHRSHRARIASRARTLPSLCSSSPRAAHRQTWASSSLRNHPRASRIAPRGSRFDASHSKTSFYPLSRVGGGRSPRSGAASADPRAPRSRVKKTGNFR